MSPLDAQFPVAEIRNRLRLTQAQFAKKIGISRPHLSKLENSSGELSPKMSQRIADLCREHGLTPAGVANGLRLIPVRSWAQAGVGLDYEELPFNWQRFLPTDCPDSEAFAVEIEGDSMEPKFSAGDVAVLMPSYPAKNGNLVVARLETEGVVFKIFTAKGQIPERVCIFASYNPVYHPIEVRERSVLWNFPVYQLIRQVWR